MSTAAVPDPTSCPTDGAQRPTAPLGVSPELAERPDVLAYLEEVQAAADALLALDLTESKPGVTFDPRWPESLPPRAGEGADRGDHE